MTPQFQPEQARRIAHAFQEEQVDYLFIGKSAAVLMGYPAITQDVDVFVPRNLENSRRIVRALRKVDFDIVPTVEQAILRGDDFVQIKGGPFDIDIIFAPDGISSFADAKSRSITLSEFKLANLRDIIASKRATGRDKDLMDLSYLERFRQEYEKNNPVPLKSSAEIAESENQKRKTNS